MFQKLEDEKDFKEVALEIGRKINQGIADRF